ncbi:hypothetical protein BGY98DRAFT_1125903 [Russula aff. rugulosa BPL654]|nr:hypothetical protein BGY98DRAFT_1125903 [Russula aff. rugulosa BPL654]
MSAALRTHCAVLRVIFFEGRLKLTTPSYSIAATVRLNNHFQALGRLASISYLETDNGQKAENRWTMTVKIDGEVMGSCDAPRRAVAKEAAAEQALQKLGLE